MSLRRIAESRIQEAMEAGAFQALPGEGRPLALSDGESGGENWLGFHVLQNAGLLPEWLELGREIERRRTHLNRLDSDHADFVRWAVADGNWRRWSARIASARREFASAARELRERQDHFNYTAAAPSLERPGIWVEYELARLDRRLRDAGAPAWVVAEVTLS